MTKQLGLIKLVSSDDSDLRWKGGGEFHSGGWREVTEKMTDDKELEGSDHNFDGWQICHFPAQRVNNPLDLVLGSLVMRLEKNLTRLDFD